MIVSQKALRTICRIHEADEMRLAWLESQIVAQDLWNALSDLEKAEIRDMARESTRRDVKGRVFTPPWLEG